jgi:type III secretory pathway component EscV
MANIQFYKRNAIAAAILFLVSAFVGMSIGMNYDVRFPIEYDGYYMIKKGEAMIRAAHTHGMPFALYNLILAFIIPFLGLSDKMKNLTSWFGVLMLIMPVALFLRGLIYPATTLDMLGFVGAAFFLLTSVFVLIGAIKVKKI